MSGQFEQPASPREGEAGLGLIEIVIAMFLFLLLAVAFLPLLVNGLRSSASNSTLATATQLVEQQLQKARAVGATCAAVQSFTSTVPAPVTDPRGVVLYPQVTPVASCPASYPGTVSVSVKVTEGSLAGETLAEAVTLVLVTG